MMSNFHTYLDASSSQGDGLTVNLGQLWGGTQPNKLHLIICTCHMLNKFIAYSMMQLENNVKANYYSM